MNTKKIIFVVALAVIFVVLACFATVEAVVAFLIGYCGKWVVEKIYKKFIKGENSSGGGSSDKKQEAADVEEEPSDENGSGEEEEENNA